MRGNSGQGQFDLFWWDYDALELELEHFTRCLGKSKTFVRDLYRPVKLYNSRQYRKTREMPFEPRQIFIDSEVYADIVSVRPIQNDLRDRQCPSVPCKNAEICIPHRLKQRSGYRR